MVQDILFKVHCICFRCGSDQCFNVIFNAQWGISIKNNDYVVVNADEFFTTQLHQVKILMSIYMVLFYLKQTFAYEEHIGDRVGVPVFFTVKIMIEYTLRLFPALGSMFQGLHPG
jgi:hypothetical protein